MIDIPTRNNKHRKLLICIYTNKDRNEFAIGLKEDETIFTEVDLSGWNQVGERKKKKN